jgi:uncharacterized membrane protein (GlpM family)
MDIRFKWDALRDTCWYEFLIRFVLGGSMTVVAGLIASHVGPVIGGLFLAFPAIFPASATLVEKHARERKERAGLSGSQRGRDAAALDAKGAALGSVGLAGFALVVWFLIERFSFLALFAATVAWLVMATGAWLARGRLR